VHPPPTVRRNSKGRKRFPKLLEIVIFTAEARAEIQLPPGLGKYWGDWRRKHPGTARASAVHGGSHFSGAARNQRRAAVSNHCGRYVAGA